MSKKPLVKDTVNAFYQATMDDYIRNVGVVELAKKIAWSIGSSRGIEYGRHTEIGSMARKIAEEIAHTLDDWKARG
jgi:hypothetical protein